MNFNDLMMRQGALENSPKPPFVMGFECAGVVESIGENVHGISVSFAQLINVQNILV